MTILEEQAKLEALMGVKRHPTEHLGFAAQAEQRIYIFHSQECKDSGIDLRQCTFSVAADEGIDLEIWRDLQDKTVRLRVSEEYFDLEPVQEES